MLTGQNGNIVENPSIGKDESLRDGEKTKLFLKAGRKSMNKPKSKADKKRRVRGKLSREEEVVMMRTCKNVFDWLKPSIVNVPIRKEIDINIIAHKPGITLKTKSDLKNIQIMISDRTAHTPELGPSALQTEQEEPVIDTDLGSNNLQAGFNNSQRLIVDRQKPVLEYADIRKAGMVPGSPDMSMSPGWIDGRREEFGNIGRMMEHWEEMEKREEEEGDSLGNKEEFEEGGGGTDNGKSSTLEKLTGISATKINSSPELSRPTYKSKFQNWKNVHKLNKNVTKQKSIDITTTSVDCDWLQLLANEKPGRGSGVKRKVEDKDSKISKQRVWRGPGNKN
jgi:hypothetical protein